MILTINGKAESIEKNLNLDRLVAAKGLSPEKIIVEHNLVIVAREDWPKILLKDQDSLEIISFVGGG